MQQLASSPWLRIDGGQFYATTWCRTAVENVREARPFEIDAWVLLPDHLHCIWTLTEGDADFPTRWMMIKRAVSLACRDDHHRADWMSASTHKR